ncbi:membrane protease subunit, stomatin/prohibitin [Oscillatoriales cyanobacterium USR001]|nr:membrane protease subunit, stomatin/prohibitin [Oscillatoriales cyanobacterium USR001]
MEPYILAIIILIMIGYAVNSSVRVISSGDEGLVERFGQYKKTLKPGLNFIIPLIEKLVYLDTTREQFTDIAPQSTITKDNVELQVDALVYWKVKDLQKAYYEVDQPINRSIYNIVLTTLRSEIGKLELKDILSDIQINKSLVQKLDRVTDPWGVKITRVEIQSITPPKAIQKSMELERAAASEKQAMITKAQGTADSIKLIAKALNLEPNDPRLLNFLIAQGFLESNQKLGESANSKLVFIDPHLMNESLSNLIDKQFNAQGGHQGNDTNSST